MIRFGASAVAAVALAIGLAGCSDSTSPVDGARALAHVQKLVSTGPRPPGSKALERSADYILAELRKLGLEPQEQVWSDDKEKIRFRNVWVQIDGRDPETGPILAIGAHYDTKLCSGHENPDHNFEFVGAIDGGGASGLLIELARVLEDRNNIPNVWLIWFDGEESLPFEWDDDRSLFGSKYFVKTMAADKERFPKGLSRRLKAFVLLDLIGDRDIKIDKDVTSNPQLNDIFEKAAERLGESDRMFQFELSPEFKDDHISFRKYGVTVVDLIDFQLRIPGNRREDEPERFARYQAWWHSPEDTLDKMSPEALKFAGDLIWEALPEIEETFYAQRQ